MPAEWSLTRRSCRTPRGVPVISHPRRQEALDFRPMAPHQPLPAHYARPVLVLIPKQSDPLGEAAEAAAGEAVGEDAEQGLPAGPRERSFGHDVSSGTGLIVCYQPARSTQETRLQDATSAHVS